MTDTPPMQNESLPRGDALRLWLIRAAALVGLLISGYLFYLAAKGGAPLGCGESSGCADVLGSRWSKAWRFPVSAPAMIAYLVVLAASLHAGPGVPPNHRRKARLILNTAAVAAGGAALWFISLQLFVLGHVCVFCMAAHACSLVIALAALWQGPRALPSAGLVAVGVLIAVQVFLPPPVSTLSRFVEIGGIETANAPTLGDPDAPHVVGFLYDYNCYYCLQTHRALHEAIRRYDGQLVVVLLPTAIDPACNRHVQELSPVSRTSCALARLMLAVWVADASRLAAFDAYLLEQVPRYKSDGSVPPEIVDGMFRTEAERLVGAAVLAAALDDPRIDKRLQDSANLYHVAVDPQYMRPGVPRVVIGGGVYPAFEEPAQLFQVLEAAYPGLKPTRRNE